ncbi:MAG: PKD domain-containing protein, partial [Thermoplasmatota archaeon]
MANCSASHALFGVYLVNTDGCELRDLTINQTRKGLLLFNASTSTIWGNHIHNNTYFGMELGHTSINNIIADCHIADNGNYGVYIVQQSIGNQFFHNNFIRNSAYDAWGNQWGGTYTQARGNYWSTHDGADNFKGPLQNRSGYDGFVDEPFKVPGNSGAMDVYPLYYPISDPPRFAWVSRAFLSMDPGWQHDHYDSIQMAINALHIDGGCFVYDGLYPEQVLLDRGITVTGQSTEKTKVAGNNGSGFRISGDNAAMYQFTLQDCWNDPAVHVTGDNVTVGECACIDSYYGVVVSGNDTMIHNTSIGHNAYIGAAWQDALRPVMQNCNVYGNNHGVVLSNVTDGLFMQLEIHNNSVKGIELAESSNNTVHHVYFINNMNGVYAENSTGNLFYFNDFIGNEQHAWDNGNNSWDNGTVGNYWEEFDGGNRSQGTYTIPYMVPGDSNKDNHPLIKRVGLPVSSFNYTPKISFTLQTVIFTDTSIDLDGIIVQRHWDFGDGSNATTVDATATHSYTDNGVYNVTLTVTDDDGNMGTATKTLTILNRAPTAAFTWMPPEPTGVDLVRFNGSASDDPDGVIINYTWDFGDGATGYGLNTSHLYMDSGIYNVTLTVTDDDGASSTKVNEVE